jgi:uncharacterized protein
MPKQTLPIAVDPVRFAENGTDLHGIVLIKNMPRLVPSLFSAEGEVEANVQFGIDQQGIKYLKGQIKAFLTMQCQRCMEAFVYEIISPFTYGMVTSDGEAATLPAQYDPVVVSADNLNMTDMVEEELMINLPIVPMHDPKDCKVTLPIVVVADAEAEAQAKKQHPFKVIESLKVKPTE